MSTTVDHYLGIDVHKTDAQVVVLDDEGQVVEEVRAFVFSYLTSHVRRTSLRSGALARRYFGWGC